MDVKDFPHSGAFADWQDGRGLSHKTIDRRHTTLRTFNRTMKPSTLLEATLELIEEWLLTYRAVRTRNAYRSDLRAYYRWAYRRRLIDIDPTVELEPIKVPKSLPRPIRSDFIEPLTTYGDDDTRLMVALAAYAGLRVFEIAALTSEDIHLHLKRPLLIVRDGKGGKDRAVPVHPDLARLIRWHNPRGRLFNLKAATIGRRLKKALSDLGLEGTGHQLRHTFGSEAMRAAKGDLLVVQYLMGHEKLDTTRGYVGWDEGKAGDVVELMFKPPPAA